MTFRSVFRQSSYVLQVEWINVQTSGDNLVQFSVTQNTFDKFFSRSTCYGPVSVHLSVRPTQASVVSKWLNAGLRKQRRTIAQ